MFVRINKKVSRPSQATTPAPTADPAAPTAPAAPTTDTGVLGTNAPRARPATRSSIASTIKASPVLLGGLPSSSDASSSGSGSASLPGVRAWVSSQFLTPTGVPAWDALLSGGLPLNTVVAVTPDTGSSLHLAMAKAWLREGARLGQGSIVLADSSADAYNALPASSDDSPALEREETVVTAGAGAAIRFLADVSDVSANNVMYLTRSGSIAGAKAREERIAATAAATAAAAAASKAANAPVTAKDMGLAKGVRGIVIEEGEEEEDDDDESFNSSIPAPAPAPASAPTPAAAASASAAAAAAAALVEPFLLAGSITRADASAIPAPTTTLQYPASSTGAPPCDSEVSTGPINSLRKYFESLIARIATSLVASGALPADSHSATSRSKDSSPLDEMSKGPGVARLLLLLPPPTVWPRTLLLPQTTTTSLPALDNNTESPVGVRVTTYTATPLPAPAVDLEYARFCHHLRAIASAARCIVWLVGPAPGPTASPAMIDASHRCGHTSMAVQSFCNSVRTANNTSAFGDFDGIISFTKFASPNTLKTTFQTPETLHFLIKLRSRGRIEMQKLSLPPEASRTSASSNPLLNPALAAQLKEREKDVLASTSAQKKSAKEFAGGQDPPKGAGCGSSGGGPPTKLEDLF